MSTYRSTKIAQEEENEELLSDAPFEQSWEKMIVLSSESMFSYICHGTNIALCVISSWIYIHYAVFGKDDNNSSFYSIDIEITFEMIFLILMLKEFITDYREIGDLNAENRL